MFLKKAIYWLIDLLSAKQFSDFAFFGDLRLYSLSDLRKVLGKNWIEKVLLFDTYQSITWSNSLSSYTLYFTLNGEFIQIKEEVWKIEKMVFSHNLK
jgi:hypothetical protein